MVGSTVIENMLKKLKSGVAMNVLMINRLPVV